MLTLLTTTGMRPEAWELCKRWMENQTYKGSVEWIVVDDGSPGVKPFEMPFNWTVKHVAPTPAWREGQNTQIRNLREGLRVIPAHARVVIIEDDDYYAPQYLTAAASWLERADLVGECNSRYYNVQSKRWAYCNNRKHCSLMSTALKGKALETFREAVMTKSKFVDIDLWAKFKGSKLLAETTFTVGIKGLPGRPGIGVGHRLQSGAVDRDGRTLKQWIGNDAEAYA